VAYWSYFFSEFFAAFCILPFYFQEVDGAIVWGDQPWGESKKPPKKAGQ
jgi:hypothetical protein